MYKNLTDGDITDVGVNGYVVSRMAAGEEIAIDGYSKLATSNGANVYSRLDFVSFPTLSTGYNELVVTGQYKEGEKLADITLKYRERY